MTRIIVVPADNGIPIGTFIFDSSRQEFAYSAPIMYDSFSEAIDDYHDAVVNGGELPFLATEGIEVWLIDLDSGASFSFWHSYRLKYGPWDKTIALTESANNDSGLVADSVSQSEMSGTLLHTQLEKLCSTPTEMTMVDCGIGLNLLKYNNALVSQVEEPVTVLPATVSYKQRILDLLYKVFVA